MNEQVHASIITIGDELLIGQVIDTNSAWIAQRLNLLGIWVKRRVAVGDVWGEIWNALDEESKHSHIILITGGLGPTADDITKPLLCQYFAGRMVVNDAALQNVKSIFARYLKRPLLEANLKQAEVPDVCTVIQNSKGTAPGMLFKREDKVFISMPGVPLEMQAMMADAVLPMLPTLFKLPAVVHRTLMTAGIGESFLADRIKEFEAALPANIKLAYLPNFALVRLRLTATGADKEALSQELDERFATLQSMLQDVMIANEDISLQEVVGRVLTAQNKTVATAESCTGGYVAHLLTTIPGSSKYFFGSIVSYDNSIKQDVLHVKAETLEAHGAVSEETVVEMAEGAKNLLKTGYAIAISGIMGPGGGSTEKPVGTVWIAVAGMKETVAKKFHSRFDRVRNIEWTAIQALTMLRQVVVADVEG